MPSMREIKRRADARTFAPMAGRWRWRASLTRAFAAVPLGYREPEDFDDDYPCLGGGVTCWGCGGSGIEVFCMDDLCRGGGECIHGDGDGPCSECNGEGVL